MQRCITRLIREPAGPQMDGLRGYRDRCPVERLAGDGVGVSGGAVEKALLWLWSLKTGQNVSELREGKH